MQETQGSNINPILIGLGIDERFARNDVTGRTYFLTDALNSTIALTDSTGAIQQQYSYDPYGNVTPSNTTTGFTNPYQYTGREADSPGLYYYRARYYSPLMGGFISEDPIMFGGGQLSFYAYVAGDPLTYIDPFGLVGIPFYIPNSKVISNVRSSANEFGYDVTKCSDNEILDFVKFIPNNEFDAFKKSYDSRPDSGAASTSAGDAANAAEFAKEQSMLSDWLRRWTDGKKKRCWCKL